jgi:hypothetical protein
MLFPSEKIEYKISKTESRILIVTSSLSVIPIYYAFHKELYSYSIVSIGTYICSLLYWIDPKHGWRRNLDLMYAKFSFVIYFGSGIIYVPTNSMIIFMFGTTFIYVTYILTMIFPKKWLRYHALFHISSILMKIYILSFITPKPRIYNIL